MIREAIKQDIDNIILICEIFFKDMEFEKNGIRFEANVFRENILTFMASKEAYIIVAEENKNLLGIGAVLLYPEPFSSRKLAVEYIWHSLSGLGSFQKAKIFRELFEEMEKWAKMNEAKTFHVSTSPFGKFKAAGKFLEKRGYSLMDIHYSRELG